MKEEWNRIGKDRRSMVPVGLKSTGTDSLSTRVITDVTLAHKIKFDNFVGLCRFFLAYLLASLTKMLGSRKQWLAACLYSSPGVKLYLAVIYLLMPMLTDL